MVPETMRVLSAKNAVSVVGSSGTVDVLGIVPFIVPGIVPEIRRKLRMQYFKLFVQVCIAVISRLPEIITPTIVIILACVDFSAQMEGMVPDTARTMVQQIFSTDGIAPMLPTRSR